MALLADTAWRIRASGNDANGGGFSGSQSGALATTLNGSISSGATTIVVASATGWPASGNFYARIGAVGPEQFSSGSVGSSEIVLVTGGQGTTSWTVTRAQKGTSAQAFASGIAVDNNHSQGTGSTFSGSVGTSTASTTFTDAAGAFNETVVGNILWIASGTGATVGPYLITGYTSATQITLDRASGTYTAGVWKIGGAWASTPNVANANIAAGNVIYIRAGGSGSVGSPDFTPTTYYTPKGGDLTNGFVRLISENGRAYLKAASGTNMVFYNCAYNYFEGFYLISNGTSVGSFGIIYAATGPGNTVNVKNCIFDQNGFDVIGLGISIGSVLDCEIFSSTSATGTTYAGLMINSYASLIDNCNIHDCTNDGIAWGSASGSARIRNSIIAKNKLNGINVTGPSTIQTWSVEDCTIDANLGHGIKLNDNTALLTANIKGNIISNHQTSGKYPIECAGAGSAAQNDRLRGIIDYNAFYNNLNAAPHNLTSGNGLISGSQLHDISGTDPQFTAQSTQDYSIGTNLKALGYPQSPFLQSKSGQTTGVRCYTDAGGVQRQEAGGSTTIIVPNINQTIFIEDAEYAA